MRPEPNVIPLLPTPKSSGALCNPPPNEMFGVAELLNESMLFGPPLKVKDAPERMELDPCTFCRKGLSSPAAVSAKNPCAGTAEDEEREEVEDIDVEEIEDGEDDEDKDDVFVEPPALFVGPDKADATPNTAGGSKGAAFAFRLLSS